MFVFLCQRVPVALVSSSLFPLSFLIGGCWDGCWDLHLLEASGKPYTVDECISSRDPFHTVSGWIVSQEKQSCGAAAINSIVGKRVISDIPLCECQAIMGFPKQVFEEKGTKSLKCN